MSEPSPGPNFNVDQVLASTSLEDLDEYLDHQPGFRIVTFTAASVVMALLAIVVLALSRSRKGRARVTIDGESWIEVNSLAMSGPGDRHFVVDRETGTITFGDGTRGARVPPGAHVEASYRVCCPSAEEA